MFRPALRSITTTSQRVARSSGEVRRRAISTAPPHQKSRGWRSSAARWGLAAGLVYYYNTSSVFADETAYAIHSPPETERETEALPTIEAVAEQRRAQARTQKAAVPAQTVPTTVTAPDQSGAVSGSPEGLEEEASQQGAFNEETGEINWDCPCLGGMATGPCGEQFKAAFSCFVYSKEEPKGVDCIEHFKTMQNCFREHPDVYGAELDEEDAPPADALDGEDLPSPVEPSSADGPTPSLANTQSPHGRGEKVADHMNGQPDSDDVITGKRERSEAATAQVKKDHEPQSESDDLIPKAAHDAR